MDTIKDARDIYGMLVQSCRNGQGLSWRVSVWVLMNTRTNKAHSICVNSSNGTIADDPCKLRCFFARKYSKLSYLIRTGLRHLYRRYLYRQHLPAIVFTLIQMMDSFSRILYLLLIRFN